MSKDSPGKVRLQVEVLEARSLLNATTPLLPAPSSSPAPQTADSTTTASTALATPNAPVTFPAQGPYTGWQRDHPADSSQKLAQAAPSTDPAANADRRPADGGALSWWSFATYEEIRNAHSSSTPTQAYHNQPLAPPAKVNDSSLPVAGMAAPSGPSLVAAPAHLPPVAFVPGPRVSLSLPDESERSDQESTPPEHAEGTELQTHFAHGEHTPGFRFQADTAARAVGAAAAFTPALVEARATPLSFAMAVGEPWLVARWSGVVADLRDVASGQVEGASGNPTGPDSDAQEADAAPLVELDAGPVTVASGLLADALAVDAGKLRAGIRSFLEQLDHLGTSLATSPSGIIVSCWLLAVAAAGSACEIVRRQSKRRQTLIWDGDPLFTWIPEAVEEP
jgi:hypothetical protein